MAGDHHGNRVGDAAQDRERSDMTLSHPRGRPCPHVETYDPRSAHRVMGPAPGW